jgi:hypothetical protein
MVPFIHYCNCTHPLLANGLRLHSSLSLCAERRVVADLPIHDYHPECASCGIVSVIHCCNSTYPLLANRLHYTPPSPSLLNDVLWQIYLSMPTIQNVLLVQLSLSLSLSLSLPQLHSTHPLLANVLRSYSSISAESCIMAAGKKRKQEKGKKKRKEHRREWCNENAIFQSRSLSLSLSPICAIQWARVSSLPFPPFLNVPANGYPAIRTHKGPFHTAGQKSS